MAIPKCVLDYYGEGARPQIIAVYQTAGVWLKLTRPPEVISEEIAQDYLDAGITGLELRWQGILGTYWLDRDKMSNPLA
jgi:hypothetical protein